MTAKPEANHWRIWSLKDIVEKQAARPGADPKREQREETTRLRFGLRRAKAKKQTAHKCLDRNRGSEGQSEEANRPNKVSR